MPSTKPDFFISRAGPDGIVARMIAEIIRETRATVFYEDDFGHADFMRCMEQGSESARVIALLSPEYQQSEYCRAEYNHVLGKDPANAAQRLIVLRVKPCEPTGGLQNLVYTDLVPIIGNYAALARVVRAAIGIGEPEVLQPLQRAGQQIRHPEIRSFRGFAERDALLGDLDRLLWQGRGTVALRNSKDATVALRGMGGVGKTVSAKEYAWRNHDRYHGIWWIRAEEPETLVDDLVELGKRFVPGLEKMEPKQAAAMTVDQLAQVQTEKPWLLIYDNVGDPASIRLLTPATNAHVIVTTRRTDWNGEADELPVDVFSREAAIAFLVQDGGDREAAERLADALDRLPLALSHARAYCRARGMPFDRYIANLPKLIAEAPKNAQYSASVFVTFSLAIDQAKEDCPEAETLMELLSFCAPDQIPLWLVPSDILSEESLGDAIVSLGAVSLVRQDFLPNGDPALSVHRMVQAVTRARLQATKRFDEASAKATRSIENTYDNSKSFVGIEHNSYWFSHALAIVTYVNFSTDNAYELFWIWIPIGDLRKGRGDSRSAMEAYGAAIAIAERVSKARPANAGWERNLSLSYNRMGDVLLAQGNLQEALKSFRDSLTISGRLAKTEPKNAEWQRDLSVAYNRVGDVLIEQRNFEKALESYRDGLAIREFLAGAHFENPGHQRDLSTSYIKIGDALIDRGDLQEGLKSFQDSLAIVERLTKTDPNNVEWQLDLVQSNQWIGYVYLKQGQQADAIAAFERALDICRALIDRNPDSIQFRIDLAYSISELGKIQGADGRSYLQEALDILKPLAEEDRLDARQRGWIPNIETALAALD